MTFYPQRELKGKLWVSACTDTPKFGAALHAPALLPTLRDRRHEMHAWTRPHHAVLGDRVAGGGRGARLGFEFPASVQRTFK